MVKSKENETAKQRPSKISADKILSIILGSMVVVFYVMPVGLPVPISSTTEAFYDTVEGLPDDSVVAIQCIFTATGYAEQKGQILATLSHLFSRPIKLVFFSLWVTESPPLVDLAIDLVPKEIIDQRTYGEDYVVYGYVAGEEQSMTAVGTDIWNVYPLDGGGTPTTDLLMMHDIHSADDFDILVYIGAMFPASEASIRQWGQTFKLPILMAVDAANYMALMPYFPQQVLGILNGVRGGAEYEILIKRPGPSAAFTDAISGMAIIFTVALIVGNISYLRKNGGVEK